MAKGSLTQACWEAVLDATHTIDLFAEREITLCEAGDSLARHIVDLLEAGVDLADVGFVLGQFGLAAIQRDGGQTPPELAAMMMGQRETQHPLFN